MKMKLSFCFIVFVSTLSIVPVSLQAAFCHPNWHSYESKCYRVFDVKEDFFTSDLFCMLMGGRVVAISSSEIRDFVLEKTAPHKSTKFWAGLQVTDNKLMWNNGVLAHNQSWVASDLRDMTHIGFLLGQPCSVFNVVTGTVEASPCTQRSAIICNNNKTLFDPQEHCKTGLTEHSFIGEETGRCIYRLPISTQKAKAQAKCVETGGEFLNLDSIMRDGLNSLYEHKVMTNDGLKYWTDMTWNGSQVLWPSGEVVDQHFPLVPGTGSCVTVVFNFTQLLETHLFQTECTSQAYVICGATPDVEAPLQTPTTEPESESQVRYCPQGHNWKTSSTGACYWETSYETSRMSWQDAQNYCKGFGADLASFHSREEERIGLSFQYGSLAHSYWIGLQLDPATETYRWSDGSPLDYENWAPNHPDHKDKRLRCVSMDAKSKHWTSSLCGIISWFVCKAPKRAEQYVPVVPTRPPLIPCDEDSLISKSFYFEGYCYSVVNTQFSWHRAKQYCENEGSTLVSIHSDQEIGFLLRLLYDDKDTKGNRVWIGLNSLMGGIFRWADWSPLDFTYWNENEPNNYLNQEKCCNMYIGNGLWNDENCNSQMGFICKQVKDATATPEIQTTPNPFLGNCKKGWYSYRDRCYLPKGTLEKDRLNWTEASDFCTKEGGYLTSIRNHSEQAFVAYLMQDLKADTWIGLHDTIESGKYYWTDNSHMQYTNWAAGEPSFFGLQEDCVKMLYKSLNSGVWEDDVCSKKLPFICQKDRDPNIPKPNYNRGNECIQPEGWLKLGQMCFKMFEGSMVTWEEAESACVRYGAHLVSLTDTSVFAVANYLGSEVNGSYWIGLKTKEGNQFRWLNKWPVTLTKWSQNEPGPADEKMCYASTFQGYWERQPCTNQLPFICQITTGKPDPIIQYQGDCPNVSDEGWISTDSSSCLLFGKSRADWFAAFLMCYTYGSHMISLHSFQDLKDVEAVVHKNVPSIFLGLSRNINGGFMWSDGSPVDFVNWDVGEPENNGEDRCIEMKMDTLKWRVASCTEKRHFVCAVKKAEEVEITPEKEKLITDTPVGLSAGGLVGIVVVIVFIVAVIVIVYFIRKRPLGQSGFRIPFTEQNVSFENALYNAETVSMEFQDSKTDSSR